VTPDEINKAIAEVCGWIDIEPEMERFGIEDLPNGHFVGYNQKKFHSRVPNYASDLNAMHEARRRHITPGQRDVYLNWLARIVERERRMAPVGWLVVDATAPQHAEAFLRTVGKWVEGGPEAEVQKQMALAQRGMKRYEGALRELAKDDGGDAPEA
jgi:hypothetical protein